MTASSFSLTDTETGQAFALIPASDKPIGTSACSTCFSKGTCDHGKKVAAKALVATDKQINEEVIRMNQKDEDNKAAVAASVHMAEGLSVPFRLLEQFVPSDSGSVKTRVLQYRLMVDGKYFWVDVPVVSI